MDGNLSRKRHSRLDADGHKPDKIQPGIYGRCSPRRLDDNKANFPDVDPISILFKQTAVANAQNDPRLAGLGLRFNMNSVNNDQGLVPVVDDWTSFGMELVDPNVQPPEIDGVEHPTFPHFHGIGTPNPFNYVSGGGAGGGGPRNSIAFLNYGNDGTVGPTGPTQTFESDNIGVHDYEINGLQRQFTLVLQPNMTFTPAPVLGSGASSFAVSGGVLALFLFTRRANRRSHRA
jgi:hypothetical protein